MVKTSEYQMKRKSRQQEKMNRNIKRAELVPCNAYAVEPVDLSVLYIDQKTNYKRNTENVFHILERELLIEQMKPCLRYLQVIGCFPVRLYDTGELKFSYMMMLYSLTIYSFIMYSTTLTFINAISDQKSNDEFIDYMYLTMKIAMPLNNLIIPVIWIETSSVVCYMNLWTKLQVQFFQLTGHPVILALRLNALLLIVIFMFTSPAIALLSPFRTTTDFWAMISSIVSWHCFFLLTTTWRLHCNALHATAKQMRTRFKEQFARRNNRLDVLSAYRSLWLQLNELTLETGNVYCHTHLLSLIFGVGIFSIMSYDSLVELGKGISKRSITMAVYVIYTIVHIFVFCDSPHQVVQEISSGMKNELQGIELGSTDLELRNEVREFLQAIRVHPTEISLGGYIVVNRAYFISVCSTVATYLIVLIQFGESSHPEVHTHHRSNNSSTAV